MKSLLSKCILILTVTHGLNVAAATVAEERETEFTALRQKIEKKIGLEKLQILDKLGGEIFTKWSDRQAATGSAQTYFRGGKIGTDEEKKSLRRHTCL